MAKVSDVVLAMEGLAPLSLAEEWDNVGLMVGDPDREVSKIIVMLDLDENGLKEALDVEADMIITHHPFIMSPLKSVTDKTLLGVIENKIAVCSMHTNLDRAAEGVNFVLAQTVGLENIEDVLFEGFEAKGGHVEECSFGDYLQHIKLSLNIGHLRYVGDKDKEISKVCVIGGSGGDFIPAVAEQGFDVLLTADVKYHQAQLAQKLGLLVIDAGHFETENPVIYRVARYLMDKFEDVDVITSLRSKSYIKYE